MKRSTTQGVVLGLLQACHVSSPMFAAVSLSQDSTVLSLRLFLVLSRRRINPEFGGLFQHLMRYVRPGEKEILNSAGGVLHPFEAGVGVEGIPTLVIVFD
jgi:hypothetical protein